LSINTGHVRVTEGGDDERERSRVNGIIDRMGESKNKCTLETQRIRASTQMPLRLYERHKTGCKSKEGESICRERVSEYKKRKDT
jgi:hypothetical protein